MTKPRFNVMDSIKRLHHAVPLNIRYRYSLFFWQCRNHLNKFYDPLCPLVTVYEGHEKNSGCVLSFAYAGSHTQTHEHWLQAAFSTGYKKTAMGRLFFLSILPCLRRSFPECHFIVREENDLTQTFVKTGFRVPEWIDMDIDISPPLEKLLGNQREGIQRRIRKFGLTAEITRDPKYFDDFYYNMYVPYMQKRHTSAAAIDTYSALSDIFERGELILVKDGNEVLCGGLFEAQGSKVRCRKIGVRNGDWEYVKEGVIGACYYFLIDEMKKRGYKKMHLGGTRPFLSDGVTKFKVSLKAELAYNQRNSCLSLLLLKNSPGLQTFLNANPFICYEKAEAACRAVFFQSIDRTDEEFNDMIEAAVCHGLADTHIFVFGTLVDRSNYFFSVKPAWPLFDHTAPLVPEKTVKISWIKRLLHKFSVAGG